MERGMLRRIILGYHDLALRLGGCFGGFVGAVALARLYALVHALPRHDPTSAEVLLAAIAFVGASGGCALMVLGDHVNDQVMVALRWSTIPDQDALGEADRSDLARSTAAIRPLLHPAGGRDMA